ncbi:MAG: hypothetical protein QME94_05840, partial [Anaerolineae bacterium]|nr:hypothetical protein [Anaerolineae bacterium]
LNVGVEDETTIERLALEIIALAGSRSTLTYVPYEAAFGARFAEPRRRVPDASKARRLLGFTPEVSLRDGLKRTIDWFRAERAVSYHLPAVSGQPADASHLAGDGTGE